jgi:hypothetical protein
MNRRINSQRTIEVKEAMHVFRTCPGCKRAACVARRSCMKI